MTASAANGVSVRAAQPSADVRTCKRHPEAACLFAGAERPLARAGRPRQIQFEAVRALGRYLGANRVGYAEDQGDGQTALVWRHHVDGVAGIEGPYRYADHGAELLRSLRAGRALVRPDIANDATLGEAERRAHARLEAGATLHVPLLKGGALVAVLFLHFCQAQPALAADLPIAEAVANRTWEAVERARVEAALRRSEEKYRTLVTSMEEGFALCELVRDVDGRAVDCHCLEIEPGAGTADRAGARAAGGLLHQRAAAGRARALGAGRCRGVERGESGRFEREVQALERWFDVKVAPHGSDHFALFFDDITERKRTEAALRASETALAQSHFDRHRRRVVLQPRWPHARRQPRFRAFDRLQRR